MRRIVWSGALALAAFSTVRADQQADMKALIAKAIKAAGGEARLAKFKAETLKGKGKFYGRGDGVEYTGEWAIQHPDKMRVQIDTSANDMKFTYVRVVNGDKVWVKLADQTRAIDDKDEIAEAKESLYAGWVESLQPLKDKGFELAPLGEVMVHGKPALGVRVSHKGHRDVNLFFDKDKGLLVRVETRVKDVMGGGQEMTQETLLSDYKEVNGMQRPMKVIINRDGKKYIDAEMAEIEPKEKLDDSVFAMP